MNYIIYLIYLKVVLARSFTRLRTGFSDTRLSYEYIYSPFSAENVTKMSQIQNEPKTNPNEPNFLEVFGGKTLILA